MHLKDHDTDANIVQKIEEKDEASLGPVINQDGAYQGPDQALEEEKMEELSEFVMGAANEVDDHQNQGVVEQ